MDTFPSLDEVKARLGRLTLKELEEIAVISGVPFTTIYKIRRGETENPGIETVRRFLAHLPAAV